MPASTGSSGADGGLVELWISCGVGEGSLSAIFEGRIILIMCYHSTVIVAIPPLCMSLKQCVSSSSVNQNNILRSWFQVIINLQALIPDKGNVFCPIGGVKMPASTGSPGADGGLVELWISCGVGEGSLSKRPSDGPSSCTYTNLLAQSKLYRARSRKRRKRLCMKGPGASLGLDVSNGDCPIASFSIPNI